MAHEFPAKLRLTMALLGCDSRKELGARFREVNPGTAFDLERSHKWLQGRSQPRSAQVYEDWARLLRSDRPGAWLADCGLDSFLDEVCTRFATDREDLERRAGLADGHAVAGTSEGPAAHYLCGQYAAYSHAWSPYFSGQAIRGLLTVQPGRGARLPVVYREQIPAGPVEVRGSLTAVGRMLHIEMRDPASGTPLYITTFMPGWPVRVLCGVMSGATFMSPDPAPSATRIACLRVPTPVDSGRDQARGYLPFGEDALAADLTALGIAPARAAAVELCQFLGQRDRTGVVQVSQADQTVLATVLDQALAGDGRLRASP